MRRSIGFITSPAQDGSACIWDIFGLIFVSGSGDASSLYIKLKGETASLSKGKEI